MANEQDSGQGGFPPKETGGQSGHSTTGDGHPPRPGEEAYAGGGGGSSDAGGNAGQQETGGTGGYGGTSDAASGQDQAKK
jgi:hypothetical protein